MRLTKYNLFLNENKQCTLVEEDTKNYSKSNSLRNAQTVVRIFNDLYHADKQAEEHAYLLALNNGMIPLGLFELSHGTVKSSFMTPREIMIRVLLCGASEFILLHNHPSGVVDPSNVDIMTTEQIGQAASIMGLDLLDHIIIGQGCFYSFMENGLIRSGGKEIDKWKNNK